MFGWRNKRGLAVGAAGLVLLALGACRKPATGGSVASILRISQRNEPASLDPQLATLPDEYFSARALFEGLVTPSPHGGAPLPGVARSWNVSADGLVWTFHLRADARWSNGDPVTAADFVYSYRRMLTPALAAAKAPLFFAVRNAQEYCRGTLGDFAAVGFAAPDSRTFIITFSHSVPYLPALAATGAWLPVHPATLEREGAGRDSHWAEPGRLVGNGPYQLTAWLRSQHLEFSRNPHYWNAAAVAVPTLRLVSFDSGDAEERAFRSGQLDLTLSVPIQRIAHYAAQEPDRLRRQPLFETRYLALNLQHGPLADARVRRALSLVIDRSALTTRVLQGGQRPALSLIPPGLGGYTPAETLGEDVAAARQLLAAAGYPGGRGFPRLEFSTWTNTPVLEVLQQRWKNELGIDTGIVLREGRAHLAALAAGDFDLALMPLIPDYDDPSDGFADFLTAAPTNYGRWHEPAYDTLVQAADQNPDPGRRLAQYQAAEKILLHDLPAIPLYFGVQNYLISPQVHGWQTDRLWTRFYSPVSLHEN
jgi:oligopeptide transport system substrate-binding protein